MKTTYDFIDENRRKTILLILLFPISLAILTYISLLIFVLFSGQTSSEQPINISMALSQISGIYLGVFAVVIIVSGLWTLISFYMGHDFILSSAQSQQADLEKDKEIIRLVENLAITAGLPMPKVYIMNDPALNAFATGRDPNNSYVVLTTGIIERLEKSELETVIAHEMAHIGNRDTRLMMIIILVIGFFTFVGGLLLRSPLRSRGNAKNNKGAIILIIIGLILYLYGTIVAPLIRLAISRRREFQADATAALITRNPQGLISALKKISSNPRISSFDKNELMAPMCIASPLRIQVSLFNSLSGLFSTHPPIEKRIEALQTMDGTSL